METKKISVYEEEQHTISDNLISFIDRLSELLESIPEEYRQYAEIDFTPVEDWDDECNVAMEIEYERPETKEELTNRLKKEAMWKTNNDVKIALQIKRGLEQCPNYEDVLAKHNIYINY